jgi:hypothetical protein
MEVKAKPADRWEDEETRYETHGQARSRAESPPGCSRARLQ